MPDFDKLNAAATKLAVLTEPRNRHPGLTTWSHAVAELWKEIIVQWGEEWWDEET